MLNTVRIELLEIAFFEDGPTTLSAMTRLAR